jgi:hypothetical protein
MSYLIEKDGWYYRQSDDVWIRWPEEATQTPDAKKAYGFARQFDAKVVRIVNGKSYR